MGPLSGTHGVPEPPKATAREELPSPRGMHSIPGSQRDLHLGEVRTIEDKTGQCPANALPLIEVSGSETTAQDNDPVLF